MADAKNDYKQHFHRMDLTKEAALVEQYVLHHTSFYNFVVILFIHISLSIQKIKNLLHIILYLHIAAFSIIFL